MAGASAATGCGGANGLRPGGMSDSLAWLNASSCSATSSENATSCPVALARSQPCTSTSVIRRCNATMPGTVPNGTVTTWSRAPAWPTASSRAAAEAR